MILTNQSFDFANYMALRQSYYITREQYKDVAIKYYSDALVESEDILQNKRHMIYYCAKTQSQSQISDCHLTFEDVKANDWILIGKSEEELTAFFKENNSANKPPLPPSKSAVFSLTGYEAGELFIEKGLPVLNLSLLLSILMLLIKILVEIK